MIMTMTLIELMELLDENKVLIVRSFTNRNELCRYDKRNSIPEEFNENRIRFITIENGNQVVYI